MTDANKALANLAPIGKLAVEPGGKGEIDGLIASAEERLRDARNEQLALSGRFDLAYCAAHALSLAALRWHGYRSQNRYLAFQALPHTLGQPPGVWRVLAKAHDVRNAAEYEGHSQGSEQQMSSGFSPDPGAPPRAAAQKRRRTSVPGSDPAGRRNRPRNLRQGYRWQTAPRPTASTAGRTWPCT